MPLSLSSRHRAGICSAVLGCGLLGLVIPLLWAESDGSTGTAGSEQSPVARDSREGRPAPILLAQATKESKKKEAATGESGTKDRMAALQSDAEQAAKQLEEGKLVDFIENYFPVNDLRGIREHMTVRQAARDPRFTKPILQRMAAAITLCAKAKPVLSQGDGIATFEVTLVPPKTEAVEETPKPAPTIAVGPLPGYGKDLSKALKAAADQVKKKEWEKFVLAFYPLPEAQHLKGSGQLADLLYVIEENPQMAVVIQQDLDAMQKAKPVLTDKDSTAEFKLTGKADEELVIRLQLVDGNWRLNDFASPVRKQIAELASGKSAGANSPEAIVVKWERIGSRWRLLGLEFIEP